MPDSVRDHEDLRLLPDYLRLLPDYLRLLPDYSRLLPDYSRLLPDYLRLETTPSLFLNGSGNPSRLSITGT